MAQDISNRRTYLGSSTGLFNSVAKDHLRTGFRILAVDFIHSCGLFFESFN